MQDSLLKKLMEKGFSPTEAQDFLRLHEERVIEKTTRAFAHIMTDVVKSIRRTRFENSNGKTGMRMVDNIQLLNRNMTITVWNSQMSDENLEMLVNQKTYFSITSVKQRDGRFEYTGKVISTIEAITLLGLRYKENLLAETTNLSARSKLQQVEKKAVKQ